MPANIPVVISQKFKFWSFASMVMLVFVHGYNLNLRYLQSATVVNEPLTVNSFTQYFYPTVCSGFYTHAVYHFGVPVRPAGCTALRR